MAPLDCPDTSLGCTFSGNPNTLRGREGRGSGRGASQAMYAANVILSPHALILSCLDRTQRLKDARSEAAKELESHKVKKDAELKDFESKVHESSYQ